MYFCEEYRIKNLVYFSLENQLKLFAAVPVSNFSAIVSFITQHKYISHKD